MDVCCGPLQAREDPRSSSSTFELDLLEDFVTVRSKAIYEEAQACSSQRTGGSLYASSTSKSSSWNTQGMPPNRTFQPSSSMQAGSSVERRSSLRNGILGHETFSRHFSVSRVSPSGNPLLTLPAPEDDVDFESFKEDLRRWATPVAGRRPSRDRRFHAHDAPEKPRTTTSYPLLLPCFLAALALFFAIENVLRVKSPRDWIEPKGDDGGRDWSFGIDAPPPHVGAAVPPFPEERIADWATGTRRVTASVDAFGSVAVSEEVGFRDVPLFWGWSFSGGDALEEVLGRCSSLVQASGKGAGIDGGDGPNLAVVSYLGKKYVNVDVATREGIERAAVLALGSSGMADVVYSPLLQEASTLFSRENQGRLFLLARHPVERELARFRRLREASSEGSLETRDDPRNMSYDDFADSRFVADNWMTRTLVNKAEEDELTARDMSTAKEILRRKAVIGLYSDFLGAVRHFSRYFGWDNALRGGTLSDATLQCFQKTILEEIAKEERLGQGLDDDQVREGSNAWQKIMEKNKFDHELFLYLQGLYKYQILLS